MAENTEAQSHMLFAQVSFLQVPHLRLPPQGSHYMSSMLIKLQHSIISCKKKYSKLHWHSNLVATCLLYNSVSNIWITKTMELEVHSQ